MSTQIKMNGNANGTSKNGQLVCGSEACEQDKRMYGDTKAPWRQTTEASRDAKRAVKDDNHDSSTYEDP